MFGNNCVVYIIREESPRQSNSPRAQQYQTPPKSREEYLYEVEKVFKPLRMKDSCNVVKSFFKHDFALIDVKQDTVVSHPAKYFQYNSQDLRKVVATKSTLRDGRLTYIYFIVGSDEYVMVVNGNLTHSEYKVVNVLKSVYEMKTEEVYNGIL